MTTRQKRAVHQDNTTQNKTNQRVRRQSHNAIGWEGTSKNTGSAREVADSRGSGRCGEHLCGNFQALQEVREGHAMSGSNMITTDRREPVTRDVKTR